MDAGRHTWLVTTSSGRRVVKVACGSYDEALHRELSAVCALGFLQPLGMQLPSSRSIAQAAMVVCCSSPWC